MSTHTVLIADDSQISRMLIGAIIRRAYPDARIIEAEDGVDALNKIGNDTLTVATVDLHMPEMGGLDLAQRLRARFPKLKMGLLTADALETIGPVAADLDLIFITKPINEAQMLSFLGEADAARTLQMI